MANSKKSKAKKAKEEDLITGCCTITFNGSVNTFPDVTLNQCITQANNFPGSTYNFTPGPCV